jgi:hypothetical protein
MLFGARTRAVNIHTINPLSDPRWDDLVGRHPRASVFHHRGWLEALARTYGYEPRVLTSTPANRPLNDGIVLCRVSSWITGTRLVSLPFADHCEPLLNDSSETPEIMNFLRAECGRQRLQYIEFRPRFGMPVTGDILQPTRSYWLHEVDTTPSLEQIFRGLHKNSFQRKIRRAEREHLSYEVGRSSQLVDEFYHLLLITRRRQQLLPQPRRWFENLVECMGDKIQIRLARKNGVPIAAILTLRHRSCTVYKYGCSEAKFHNLGGMPFLFWRLVEESKALGEERIDLGRSDLTNLGLITFKDRLGAVRKLLTYYRYTNTEKGKASTRWEEQGLGGLFSMLPNAVLSTVGGVLYRHIG